MLAQVEASGLLKPYDERCYPLFRTLLEACRAVGDSEGASRVQAVMEQLDEHKIQNFIETIPRTKLKMSQKKDLKNTCFFF